MKAVILAGGLGTRLSEETSLRPKPMVEIGGFPIIWHIMKIYSSYGINDFIICCGYKGYVIKEYFSNYLLHRADVRIDLSENAIEVLNNDCEPWSITLVDTGLGSMTGGRLRRVREYLGQEDFCMTYGDGVADVDISALVDAHRRSGCLATLTAVQPPGRFGALEFGESDFVVDFNEKPQGDGSWVNGGYFVLNPKVLDLINGDDTVWEEGPLRELAKLRQLNAYRHDGFWKPMDTLRDKNSLEELWSTGLAPWRCWR